MLFCQSGTTSKCTAATVTAVNQEMHNTQNKLTWSQYATDLHCKKRQNHSLSDSSQPAVFCLLLFKKITLFSYFSLIFLYIICCLVKEFGSHEQDISDLCESKQGTVWENFQPEIVPIVINFL